MSLSIDIQRKVNRVRCSGAFVVLENGSTRVSNLGDFVRNRRLELGLSQEELGERIGRNQEYISRLERGIPREPVPAPEYLSRLARELGATDVDLLRIAGYPVGEDQPQARRPVWAGKADDFTEDEDAIVNAVIEQIRRNKAEGSGSGVDRN